MDIIKSHKRFFQWFQEKFELSDYSMGWIAFIEGLLIGLFIGLIIYHFLF